MPQVEAPPRLSKQFTQLAAGIALAKGKCEIDDEVFRVIRKVGWDTIPGLRKKMVLAIRRSGKDEVTANEVSNLIQIPYTTVLDHLEDLMALGTIVRTEPARHKFNWAIHPMYKGFLDEIGEDEIQSIKYSEEVKYEEYQNGLTV